MRPFRFFLALLLFLTWVVPFLVGMAAALLWIGFHIGWQATFEITDWVADRR